MRKTALYAGNLAIAISDSREISGSKSIKVARPHRKWLEIDENLQVVSII